MTKRLVILNRSDRKNQRITMIRNKVKKFQSNRRKLNKRVRPKNYLRKEVNNKLRNLKN